MQPISRRIFLIFTNYPITQIGERCIKESEEKLKQPNATNCAIKQAIIACSGIGHYKLIHPHTGQSTLDTPYVIRAQCPTPTIKFINKY